MTKRLEILRRVRAGAMAPEEADRVLAEEDREADLGYARVDLERPRRCGLGEVIYAEGKTPEQVIGIVGALAEAGQPVFATRVSPGLFDQVAAHFPEAEYHPEARILTVGVELPAAGVGRVAVVCAGTSDIPVAEEAALTAAWMGAAVDRVYDVGVAGLHRLTSRMEQLRTARVLVVVAGMEGALPSVVGGLVAAPIIAVPTHVGYGMNLGGVTTLLAMMNSCAAGVTVVNVDNGFGAGVAAAMINRLGEPETTSPGPP
jgi:hypothetical protein